MGLLNPYTVLKCVYLKHLTMITTPVDFLEKELNVPKLQLRLELSTAIFPSFPLQSLGSSLPPPVFPSL